MVVAAFPVVKLGALLLKQVSKPLANLVKVRAKNSPFFRNYICMPPAQFYHWAEIKMKMWSMNLGKPVNIPKLNEALAIDLGAELLGEGIIFTIAAGILIAEYVRSSRKEIAREEALKTELNTVQNDLRELYTETAKQEAQIKELVRILKISLPAVKYEPRPFDRGLIPERHRIAHVEEEEPTMYATVKGWLWSAIDVIVPTIDEGPKADAEAKKPTLVVISNKAIEAATASMSGVQLPKPVSDSSSASTSNSLVSKSFGLLGFDSNNSEGESSQDSKNAESSPKR